MQYEPRTLPGRLMLRAKGKHAASTAIRRITWENVVWPLILELNRQYFTLDEFHNKRNQFCRECSMSHSKIAGGLVSLVTKGIVRHDGNFYFVHYRLVPYLRKKVILEYGQVTREIQTKH